MKTVNVEIKNNSNKHLKLFYKLMNYFFKYNNVSLD